MFGGEKIWFLKKNVANSMLGWRIDTLFKLINAIKFV